MKTEKLLNALKGNAEVREAIKNLAEERMMEVGYTPSEQFMDDVYQTVKLRIENEAKSKGSPFQTDFSSDNRKKAQKAAWVAAVASHETELSLKDWIEKEA